MKKFSWIFALILALSMAFVFTGCPGPDDDTPPVDNSNNNSNNNNNNNDNDNFVPNPNVTEISVVFEEEFAQKGAGSLSYADGGYTYEYGTGANTNYGNAIVRFKVNLGTARLGDFGGVSFNWTGISGDVGLSPADPSYTKNLFILASADEDDVTPYKDDAAIKSVIVNTDYYVDNPGAQLYSGSAGVPGVKGPGKFEIATPIVRSKTLTGEVWFAFYFHAEDGSYSIDSFKLVPVANFVEKNPTPPEVPETPPPPVEPFVWQPVITASTSLQGSGEYIGNTGIKRDASATELSFTPIENGFKVNLLDGQYKPFCIQVGTAAGGTNYYTSDGFVAATGTTYTITFKASVESGTGSLRISANGQNYDSATTKQSESLTTTETDVEFTWEQGSGGNLKFDTGDSDTGTVIIITGIKIVESED